MLYVSTVSILQTEKQCYGQNPIKPIAYITHAALHVHCTNDLQKKSFIKEIIY